jgi:hypothetical protein
MGPERTMPSDIFNVNNIRISYYQGLSVIHSPIEKY